MPDTTTTDTTTTDTDTDTASDDGGGGYRVRIENDLDAGSPREDDNLGTLVLFHRSVELPREGDPEVSSEIMYRLFDRRSTLAGFREVREWLTTAHDASVVLGVWVWAGEHGKIRLRTGDTDPFAAPETGELAGVIWTSRARRAEIGPAPDTDERVAEVLAGEVSNFDTWINGGLRRFVVERRDPSGWVWVEVASEGDFYDEGEARAEAEQAIPVPSAEWRARWYAHAELTAAHLDDAGVRRLIAHLAARLAGPARTPAGKVYAEFRSERDSYHAKTDEIVAAEDADEPELVKDLEGERDEIHQRLAELAVELDDLARRGVLPEVWLTAPDLTAGGAA